MRRFSLLFLIYILSITAMANNRCETCGSLLTEGGLAKRFFTVTTIVVNYRDCGHNKYRHFRHYVIADKYPSERSLKCFIFQKMSSDSSFAGIGKQYLAEAMNRDLDITINKIDELTEKDFKDHISSGTETSVQTLLP